MNDILNQIPWGLAFNGFSLLIIVWWIRGMPDRKRAATEKELATSKVESEKREAEAKLTAASLDRLVREVDRLDARIVVLEKTVAVKDTTIADLVALKLETLAQHAAERVVATAKEAEQKHIIHNLRQQIIALSGPNALVAATEHVAEATARVADAAELLKEPKK